MPAHPWFLYIKYFTLLTHPMWMLWRMSEEQHQASQSPNLEQSLLPVTGLMADNLYFVVLSQSHSYLEFVPLGQWYHTLPTQLIQLYKGEYPQQGQ